MVSRVSLLSQLVGVNLAGGHQTEPCVKSCVVGPEHGQDVGGVNRQ